MRSRWIIAGLSAALAVGGSSVYAANSHGVAVSTLARSTTLDGRAHGEAVSDLASQHAVAVRSAEAGTAPATAQSTAPTTTCADARSALVTLHQADRAEDTAERAAARAEDRTENAATRGEGKSDSATTRSEDRTEPAGDTTEDQSEAADRTEDQPEQAALKAARTAVAAACGEQEVDSEGSTGAGENDQTEVATEQAGAESAD